MERHVTQAESSKRRLPWLAISSAVCASGSIFSFTWLFFRWGSKAAFTTVMDIGSHFGPSPEEVAGMAGSVLAGVALALCGFSWRVETWQAASAATIVSAHALLIWAWLFALSRLA